jgi:hypothetical protein
VGSRPGFWMESISIDAAPKRLRSDRAISRVHACELLERQAFGQTKSIRDRDVLQLAVCRLSPGDHFVGDAAAEITVLRHAADQVPLADARTEILKAVAVLRDRS